MKRPVLVGVKFLKANPPYLSGEVAWFEIDHAQTLVDMEAAEYVEAPPGLDARGKALKAPAARKTTAKKKATAKAKAAAKPKAKPKGKA